MLGLNVTALAYHPAVSGVPMVIAQKILRHRDIKLTAEVCTDEGLLPLHTAMQALPSLSSATAGHAPMIAGA